MDAFRNKKIRKHVYGQFLRASSECTENEFFIEAVCNLVGVRIVLEWQTD